MCIAYSLRLLGLSAEYDYIVELSMIPFYAMQYIINGSMFPFSSWEIFNEFILIDYFLLHNTWYLPTAGTFYQWRCEIIGTSWSIAKEAHKFS